MALLNFGFGVIAVGAQPFAREGVQRFQSFKLGSTLRNSGWFASFQLTLGIATLCLGTFGASHQS